MVFQHAVSHIVIFSPAACFACCTAPDRYRRLVKRVCATIDAAFAEDEDCNFGGGDDHTYMDLPGELVGRGREVYLDHVGDAKKLAQFGDGGQVREGFPYIFHPFNERMAGMRAVAAAQPGDASRNDDDNNAQ